MVKLNAKQLRSLQPAAFSRQTGKKNEIYIILDNVLDTYNVGSFFRLADAVGAKKLFLCGQTSIPPNPRIKKASINTTEIVDWEYAPDVVGVIKNLKLKITNLEVVAVEQSSRAVRYDKFGYKLPIALVVGNESIGIPQKVLDAVDGIVEVPMFGVNVSLNVVVSGGIVLYKVLEKCPRPVFDNSSCDRVK